MEFKSNKTMIYSMVLIFYAIVSSFCAITGLVLKNNGYEGLTIIIKDTVKEDDFNGIVESIKLRFTEASRALFKATNKRAYFRQVTIVIPRSWKNWANIEKISSVNIFSEHIRIEPTNRSIPFPYVRGNLECGKPAWYMRIDPKWMFDSHSVDGLHEKVIVHEWGHLRWGLFDERASISHKKWRNPGDKVYFDSVDKDGQPKPVACTRGIQGEAKRNCNSQEVCSPKEALEDPDCKFCPYSHQPNIKASIMSNFHNLPEIEQFCDEDSDSVPEHLRHDASSRNAQNKYCDGRSTWEVIRNHEDFKDGRNPPRAEDDTTPVFQVLQEGGRSRVLVLDTSGSMFQEDRIIKQKDAAHLAIDTVIQTGSCLGIVQFTDGAIIRAPMTYIDGPDTKNYLKKQIPTNPDGHTEILFGLETAIQTIEDAQYPCTSTTKGSEIVLLSDGMSNGPYLEEISPSLIEKGIIVHTVAITNEADPNMTELSRRTGGRSFIYLQTQTVSLTEALVETLTTNGYRSYSPEKIMGAEFVVSKASPVFRSFIMDEGFGNQTMVTVEFSNSDFATLSMVEPSGKTHEKNTTGRLLVAGIPGSAEVGTYNFTLTTASAIPLKAAFAVYSQPVSPEVDIVRVISHLSKDTVDFNAQDELKLYVDVTQGIHPVLDANVTAMLDAGARFEAIRLVVEDSGIGADAVKDDGIYSAYLLKRYFTIDSHYNIKIWATNTDDTFVYTEDIENGALSENFYYKPVPVENFQRQSVAPLIGVVNFVDSPPDTTSPSRIIDLDVDDRWEEIDENNQTSGSITFSLVWTAVGDDMTVGQASKYDIRMSTDVTLIRKEFDKAIPLPVHLPSPLQAGQRESVNLTLSFSDCNGTCYIAMRTCDKVGQWSKVSNILPIAVKLIDGLHRKPTGLEDDKILATALSATSCAVIGFVLAVSAGFYFCIRKRRSAGTRNSDLAYNKHMNEVEINTA